MPTGPKGEKRPADVIGAAVLVGRIATGEVEDDRGRDQPASNRGIGGTARASALDPERRRAIAQTAAVKRWAKKSP